MKKIIASFILFSFLILAFSLTAQQNPIDSLENALKNENIDSSKVKLYNELSALYRGRDNDKAFQYADSAIKLGEISDYKIGIAEAYKTAGILHFMSGEFDKAYETTNKSKEIYRTINNQNGVAACLVNTGIFNKNLGKIKKSIENYKNALNIYKEIEDKEGIAKTNFNLGNIFNQQGNYKNALDNYFESLKVFEEVDNKFMVAKLYSNIGIVYSDQNDNEKAIDNFNKALIIYAKLEDKKGVAEANNNIGNSYAENKEYSLAGDYYLKSLKLFKEIEFSPMIARLYYNLGDIKNKTKQFKKAKEYFDKSLEIYKKMNSPLGIALCYNGLGEYYYNKKDFKKASELLEKAKEISKKSDITISIEAVEWLSKTYAKKGNFKDAYNNHVLFKMYNDSIFNENNEKELTAMSMQYEYAKQEEIRKAKEKIEEENKRKIQAEKDKTNRITIIGLAIIGIAALIIAIISIFSYRRKQKANKLLAAQKQEIESKNTELEQSNEEILAQRDEIEDKNVLITEQRDIALKQKEEITSSIHYAQRIQNAILPDRKMFVNYISDYFIFFKPKDIVSGDFYWMTRIDTKLIVAAADCTGHGVPGAFMSMLGVTFLNEIVNRDKIIAPNEILNNLRTKVIDSLNQKGGETKDGMDIAISVIDTEKQEIQFSGAYNPLYIIPKDKKEVKIIKADRMPIGIYIKMDKKFTNNTIKYNKGDSIYLFSDGYIDQFGGKDERKLKSGKFQELLLKIQEKNMAEQKDILGEFLNQWKGDLDQLDDIIIIGMKL